MFHKPPDLEAWKRVWEGEGATLYAEQSESMSKDDVLTAMAGFEPALVLKDSNYYVRKPLSQLLISCVKPESHGEALCVNYLRVGKSDWPHVTSIGNNLCRVDKQVCDIGIQGYSSGPVQCLH